MGRIVYAIALVAAIYVGFTWFFLGASHPCELYYRSRVRPWLQQEFKKNPKLTDQDKQLLGIHRAVYELPPAQCLWRMLVGRTDWTP